MAFKTPIDNNTKTPPTARFDKSLGEIPENVDGIKPLIESPKITIKKAIRKSILISALVLVLTCGLVYFAYLQIKVASANLQSRQNLIYQASQKSQSNSDLLRVWQVVGPKYDQINNMLPPSDDLLGYTGVLEKIAQNTGVTQNVQLQITKKTASNLPTGDETKVAAQKGSSVDYTIDLKGNLSQFIDYLSQLENAPYFTQITNLNLSGSQGLGQDASANIGAKVYTYP